MIESLSSGLQKQDIDYKGLRALSVTPTRINALKPDIPHMPEVYQIERRFGKRTLVNEGGMFNGVGRKPITLEPIEGNEVKRRSESIS